jgi:hypothetical protein
LRGNGIASFTLRRTPAENLRYFRCNLVLIERINHEAVLSIPNEIDGIPCPIRTDNGNAG